MKNISTKKITAVIILICFALLSIFVIAPITSSTEHHEKQIQCLEEKRTDVLELTAAAVTASTVISMLPQDTGTPIANKLADLSENFLIVLCALFLEKYLLTVTGYISFKFLLPIACVILIAGIATESHKINQLAIKLVLFAWAIYATIPFSLKISDLIESTYQTSIEETIDAAKQLEEEQSTDESKDDESGFLSGLVTKVTDGVSEISDEVKNMPSRFIEALAVMIVTSCFIPIAVIILMILIIKSILGVDFDFSKLAFLKNSWKRIPEEKGKV